MFIWLLIFKFHVILANTYSILRLGVIGVLGYYFQLFLGHNASPYYRSKNRLVGRDVDVHEILEFVSLNTNWF